MEILSNFFGNTWFFVFCVVDLVARPKINRWFHWFCFFIFFAGLNLASFPLLLPLQHLCDRCWSSSPLVKNSHLELQRDQLSDEDSPLNLWEFDEKSMNLCMNFGSGNLGFEDRSCVLGEFLSFDLTDKREKFLRCFWWWHVTDFFWLVHWMRLL